MEEIEEKAKELERIEGIGSSREGRSTGVEDNQKTRISDSSSNSASVKESSLPPSAGSVIPGALSPGLQPDPKLLVVGGTDGSGTRSVVQILVSLGVVMVSEDPETYDIHGDLMGGWPPVVTPVVQETHTLDYDPTHLPEAVRESVEGKLEQLLKQAERDSHKPESFKLAKGGRLSLPADMIAAHGVSYGFKAPIAMALVPMWAQLRNGMKFLHVLRDGRDIAVSANQGPVQKFYSKVYPQDSGGPRSSSGKAIRLWSDWNVQVHDFCTRAAGKNSLSYHQIHSEHLVSNDLDVRFSAIRDLAKWVGSSLSNDAICCLAQEEFEFMGSHDRGLYKRAGAQKVGSRYGKWRLHAAMKEGSRGFEEAMRVGGKGLSLFGYSSLDPTTPRSDIATTGAKTATEAVHDAYTCRHMPQKCSSFSRKEHRACKWHDDMDYTGVQAQDMGAFPAKNRAGCCDLCAKRRGCQHMTFAAADKSGADGICYLKKSKGAQVQKPGLASGDIAPSPKMG